MVNPSSNLNLPGRMAKMHVDGGLMRARQQSRQVARLRAGAVCIRTPASDGSTERPFVWLNPSLAACGQRHQ